MKFKKFVVPFFAACTAITAVCGLTSCGGGASSSSGDKGSEPEDQTPTIQYQFTGEFTNDTLRGFGFDYHVLLNLTSDGKVSGSGYNCLSMDGRAASENTGFAEKWFRGSWENAKNEEDQDCVKITAIYGADAKNGMDGSTLTNTSTYYVAKKADGSLSDFRLQSPIFSGTSEYMTQMSQNKTPYENADAFIQGNLYVWNPPTGYQAVFETTADSQMMSKIYLMPEGVADVYSGKKVPESSEYKFVKGETWQWTYDSSKLEIKSKDATYTATITGTTATLEYTVNLMGNNLSYKYSCADISKLTPTETEEPPVEEAKVLATLQTEDGKTMKFYDDGKAKVDTGMPQLSPVWRYTVEGGTITFKNENDDNAPTGVTCTISGTTATVVYAPAFLNGASFTYTGDVSEIMVVATLKTADNYIAKFYGNGLVKAQTDMPQLSPVWRYTVEGGTITFKNENDDNVPSGLTFSVSGTTGTLVFAPAYLQGKSFTYVGDISALL